MGGGLLNADIELRKPVSFPGLWVQAAVVVVVLRNRTRPRRAFGKRPPAHPENQKENQAAGHSLERTVEGQWAEREFPA